MDLVQWKEIYSLFIRNIAEVRFSIAVSSTTVSMRTSSDEIVFPDGRISSMSPQRALLCRKNTFCENVADYPRQLVNAAIARNASLRFLESVDPVRDNL